MRLLLTILLCCLLSLSGFTADIYVAPYGKDVNDGSREKPLATLQAALRKARDMRRLNNPAIQGGIHIKLLNGTYFITSPVIIRPEDSGTDDSPTWIEADTDAHPVLSGGIVLNGWKRLAKPVAALSKKAMANVWVASVPKVQGNLFNFRQLWVNDVKAIRAKSANGDTMHRILNWNKKEACAVIPTPRFQNLQNAKGLEFFIHQWWEIANLRVKQLMPMGDSTRVYFEEPESKIQNEHPWPAPWLSKETGNSAFYLANALPFLDEPGEWYLDVANQLIYYWPRKGEDVNKAQVVAPFAEGIIEIKGTSEEPVRNIVLQGLQFQHTGWLRPSLQGHVPHQIGLYMTEAYKLRPPGTKEKPGLDNQAWVGRQAAALTLQYAVHTRIKKCTFKNLAATAIDMQVGVQDNITKGSLLKDIGGTAILAGNYGDEGREIHQPFNPKSDADKCDHILIENNFITNATNEDWGTVGIGCGFVSNTTIQHNEIENVSYSGISVGWGWTPMANMMRNNKIIANHIHHYGLRNYDCAGIYTLSAQPGTVVAENYIDSIYKAPYVHLPSHWFYLYTDEGSSYITVKNNWTPSQKFLQNANGSGTIWTNNGPQVDDSIKANAGLEKPFHYLLANGSLKQNIDINEEHNEIIEIVTNDGAVLDLAKLKNVLAQNDMDSNAIYNWHNHYVVYSKVHDLGVMEGRLQNVFPNTVVKAYHNMFYEYRKKKHCDDKSEAKEWTHILLTANLVADEKLQKEYLDYHATQFAKWPQVSAGFCHANFQQLLLFKHGRQLMLVISIPNGKTLDELNSKTTENNPRVDDWNKIMKKYQEGIEGTKPNETWVFLNQL